MGQSPLVIALLGRKFGGCGVVIPTVAGTAWISGVCQIGLGPPAPLP